MRTLFSLAVVMLCLAACDQQPAVQQQAATPPPAQACNCGAQQGGAGLRPAVDTGASDRQAETEHHWDAYRHSARHGHRRWRYAEGEHGGGYVTANATLPYEYRSASHHLYYGEYAEQMESASGAMYGGDYGAGYSDAYGAYEDEADAAASYDLQERSRWRLHHAGQMTINNPAALDPWGGYNDDNGFVDW